MQGEALQFLGSLAAILALAGLAWWLKLGPELRLGNQEEALAAANEAVDGFAATDVALDSEGRGALLCDREGRILLLKPHGTHYAGRILSGKAVARLEGPWLEVDTGERRYGRARLKLDDPQAWVQRIESIE